MFLIFLGGSDLTIQRLETQASLIFWNWIFFFYDQEYYDQEYYQTFFLKNCPQMEFSKWLVRYIQYPGTSNLPFCHNLYVEEFLGRYTLEFHTLWKSLFLIQALSRYRNRWVWCVHHYLLIYFQVLDLDILYF